MAGRQHPRHHQMEHRSNRHFPGWHLPRHRQSNGRKQPTSGPARIDEWHRVDPLQRRHHLCLGLLRTRRRLRPLPDKCRRRNRPHFQQPLSGQQSALGFAGARPRQHPRTQQPPLCGHRDGFRWRRPHLLLGLRAPRPDHRRIECCEIIRFRRHLHRHLPRFRW